MKVRLFILSIVMFGYGLLVSGCYTTFAASKTGYTSSNYESYDMYSDNYSVTTVESYEDTLSGDPGMVLHERHYVVEDCDPGVVVHLNFGPTWRTRYYSNYFWVSFWDDPWYYDCYWDPWYYNSYAYCHYEPYPYWHHAPYYAYYSPYYHHPYYDYPYYSTPGNYSGSSNEKRQFARRTAIPPSSRSREGSNSTTDPNRRRAVAVRDQSNPRTSDQTNERGSTRRRPTTIRDIRPDPPSERRITDRRTDQNNGQRSSSTSNTRRRIADRRSGSQSKSESKVRENTRRSQNDRQNASSSRSTAVKQRTRDAVRSTSKAVQQTKRTSSRPKVSSNNRTSRSSSSGKSVKRTPSSSSSSKSTPSVSSRSSSPSRSSGSSSGSSRSSGSSSGGSRSSSSSSSKGRRR